MRYLTSTQRLRLLPHPHARNKNPSKTQVRGLSPVPRHQSHLRQCQRLHPQGQNIGLPCPLLYGRLGVLIPFSKNMHAGIPRLPQDLLRGFCGHPTGVPNLPPSFLLYVAPLHMSVPRGLMVSYVDDFSITVASPSYWGNIRRLQGLFSTIAAKGQDIGMSYSVPKTKIIHWGTPSQRTPPSSPSIKLEGQLFRPSQVVRWLGYWFPRLQHHTPLQAQALIGTSCFLLHQTTILARSRRQTLALSRHCQRPPSLNTYLRCLPPHP